MDFPNLTERQNARLHRALAGCLERVSRDLAEGGLELGLLQLAKALLRLVLGRPEAPRRELLAAFLDAYCGAPADPLVVAAVELLAGGHSAAGRLVRA